MSYAEELCAEALDLVLFPDIERIRDFRPDFLKNPATGRNLEMDFYLPQSKVAFEIQGPHHYEDKKQEERDTLKRRLLEEAGVVLFELSIFQVSPTKLRNKLLALSYNTGRHIGLRPFNPMWLDFNEKLAAYRRSIRATYGEGICQIAPATLRQAKFSLEPMTYALALIRGVEQRVKILELVKKSAKVRVVSTGEVTHVKQTKLFKVA